MHQPVVTMLQRTAGNAAVAALLARSASESKAAPPPSEPQAAGDASAGPASQTGVRVSARGGESPPEWPRADIPCSDPVPPPRSMPAPGPSTAPPVPSLQRAEEGGGLLSRGLSWVRSGVDRLQSRARGAVEGLRSMVRSGVDRLRAATDAVTHGVGAAWRSLQHDAGAFVQAAQRAGTGLLGGLVGHIRQVGAAIVRLDANRLRVAWSALTGASGQAWTVVQGLATGALAQARAGWQRVSQLATGALDGLGSTASSLLSSVPGAARSIQATVSGAWSGLLSGAGAALRRLPGWSLVERGYDQVAGGVRAAASTVYDGARSAWTGLRARARAAWRGAQQGWDGVRGWVGRQAEGLVSGFRRVSGTVRAGAVDGLASTIGRVSGFVRAVRQAIADPGAAIDPVTQAVTGQLAALPTRAPEEARTRVTQAAGGGGAAAGGGGPVLAPAVQGPTTSSALPPSALPGPVVSRFHDPSQDRRTAGLGETLSMVWAHLTQKVTQLMPRLGEEVKKLLLSMVWPPATWEGLKEDWAHMTGELSVRVQRFSAIRTSSIGAFWEDLRRFVSNIVDFPLIIWRAVNAMLGRLSLYITLLLVLIGAGAGLAGGTIGGAIVGFLGGGGVGAAPGAPLGGAAGALAGASAGLSAALAAGTGLLLSFIAAEVNTIFKAVADMLAVPQNDEEHDDDASGIADSVIALAVAGILFALTWIGTRIARTLYHVARSVRARFTRRPPAPSSEPAPAALEPVGRARLVSGIEGLRRFAARVRERLETVQRPGARPALEARLRAIEETLARLEREARAATTPEEVARLTELREQARRDLEGLSRDIRAAVGRYPQSWDDFDARFHEQFEAELGRFRGNGDLDPTPGLRGGEGQLFLGLDRTLALKRWFASRLQDMAESLRLLRAARQAVEGHPQARAHIDVVEVGRSGGDWAVRGFDPDSIPLARAVGDPHVAAVRAQAIAALEGTTDATLQNVLAKLRSNSANLHWSPGRGKILVIDMQ